MRALTFTKNMKDRTPSQKHLLEEVQRLIYWLRRVSVLQWELLWSYRRESKLSTQETSGYDRSSDSKSIAGLRLFELWNKSSCELEIAISLYLFKQRECSHASLILLGFCCKSQKNTTKIFKLRFMIDRDRSKNSSWETEELKSLLCSEQASEQVHERDNKLK